MLGWLDSNGARVLGYLLAAGFAFVAGMRERRRARTNPDLWPTFWFLTAGLLLAMALGRAGNVAELAADIGRREAQFAGWYDNRRKYQAIVVGLVAAVWFVVIVVALWRVPERRRRYLPMALLCFTLGCFAGIRTVSLHQVDGLLYRRHLGEVRVGAVIELSLLAIAVAMTFWQPRAAARPAPAAAPLIDADRAAQQR